MARRSKEEIELLKDALDAAVNRIELPPDISRALESFASMWPTGAVGADYMAQTGDPEGQKRRMRAAFMFSTRSLDGRRPIQEVIGRLISKARRSRGPVPRDEAAAMEAFEAAEVLAGNARYVVMPIVGQEDWRGRFFQTPEHLTNQVRVFGMSSLPKGEKGQYVGHLVPFGHGDDGAVEAVIAPGFMVTPWLPEDLFTPFIADPAQISPFHTERALLLFSPNRLARHARDRELNPTIDPPSTLITPPSPPAGGLTEAVAALDATIVRHGLVPLARSAQEWARIAAPYIEAGDFAPLEEETLDLLTDGREFPSIEVLGEIARDLMGIWNEVPQPAQGGATANQLYDRQKAEWIESDKTGVLTPEVLTYQLSDLLRPHDLGELGASMSSAAEAAGVDLDWDGQRRVARLTYPDGRVRPLGMIRFVKHLRDSGIDEAAGGYGNDLASVIIESVRKDASVFDRPYRKARRHIVPFVCKSFEGDEGAWLERPLEGTDLVIRYALEDATSYATIESWCPDHWSVSGAEVMADGDSNGMSPPMRIWETEGIPIAHVDKGFSSGVLLSLIRSTASGSRSILAIVTSRDYVAYHDLIDDRAGASVAILELMIPSMRRWDTGSDGSRHIFFLDRGTISIVEIALDKDRTVVIGPPALVERLSSLSRITPFPDGRLPVPNPLLHNDELMVAERGAIRAAAEEELERSARRARPGMLESLSDVLHARSLLMEALVGDEGWYPDFPATGLADVVRARCVVATDLIRSTPYLWDVELRNAAFDQRLPPHTVSDQLLPLPLPLWFTWRQPIEIELIDEDHQDVTSGFITSMLLVPTDGGITVHSMGRRMGQRWLHTSVIAQGTRYPDAVGTADRLPLAMLAFLSANFVVVGPLARKYGAPGTSVPSLPDDEPRFVRLREIRSPKPPSDTPHPSEGREWKYRWMVRGHPRFQAYPSTDEHRWIWINAYIKGSDDKPFRPPAYKVDR